MVITKELLQLICKSLGISADGTKEVLKGKICGKLCSGEKTRINSRKITTLRSLIRYNKEKEVKEIVQDIKNRISSGHTDSKIAKELSLSYGVKIEKIDISVFAEILDAYAKKDKDYIAQKLEEWGNKAKYGIELVKAYDKKIL